jgi:hypothetical protein
MPARMFFFSANFGAISVQFLKHDYVKKNEEKSKKRKEKKAYLCAIIVQVTPMSLSIAGEISPVKAPLHALFILKIDKNEVVF